MTKCLDQGVLQALIDGELELDGRKAAEKHLAVCPECRARFAVLKGNDDFVFAKLKSYQGWIAAKTAGSGRVVPQKCIRGDQKNVNPKGVLTMARKYQGIAVAAGVLITIAVCVTVQPVRAAFAKALMILRVEDIKSIEISLQDIEEIRRQIESKTPEINVAKFGKIRINGGERENITVAEARAIREFPVAFPRSLGDATPNINTVAAVSLDFVLKVANINSVLQSLGSRTLLPETLDGQVFHIDFSRAVNLEYKLPGDQQVRIMQLRSPEISAPQDVNVDELYAALVELPIFPADLRNQLRAIKDWKDTLYIPIVDDQLTEITVNGHKGFIGNGRLKRSRTQYTMVIWMDKGVINHLYGDINQAEALNIAGSMR